MYEKLMICYNYLCLVRREGWTPVSSFEIVYDDETENGVCKSLNNCKIAVAHSHCSKVYDQK
jgi:hypothetical protein